MLSNIVYVQHLYTYIFILNTHSSGPPFACLPPIAVQYQIAVEHAPNCPLPLHKFHIQRPRHHHSSNLHIDHSHPAHHSLHTLRIDHTHHIPIHRRHSYSAPNTQTDSSCPSHQSFSESP